MPKHASENPNRRVIEVFESAPEPERTGLLRLRDRIFELAEHDGLAVEETLKWGQPSYRAPEGSPLRLGRPKTGGFAIYAHCATTLIADYAALVPGARIEGNRAVHFKDVEELEEQPIDLLIRAAFAYHAKR